MFRALLELIATIIIALAARAIMSSVMKGFANGARTGFRPSTAPDPPPPAAPPQPRERVAVAGEMHKDPVCGMYVAESTQYQRRLGRESFYYCSDKCKSQHAVTVKA